MDERVAERTFSVLTDADEIDEAEKALLRAFDAAATWTTKRTFGFPGGQEERLTRYVGDHDVWLAFSEELANRWWNAFGLGEPTEEGQTSIDLEINVPKGGTNRRVAGSFLRDDDGRLYLAHSGKIGGGRKGIGKAAFLRHNTHPVVAAGRHDHVLVGCVDDEEFVADVAAFVQSVREFKTDATSGDEEDDENVRYPEDLYWLFQANPKQFNLAEDVRKRSPGDSETWVVTRYAEWMAAGARVLLWQGGADAGIYAVGTLTGEAEEQEGSHPYKNWDSKRKWSQVPFRYDAILSKPLLKSELKDDEVLSELAVLKAPQGTNFEVEEDQWERIVELLEERGESVAQALSPETKEIVDRITHWYPDEQIRGRIVGLMADAIEAAHEVSDKAWCATSVASGKVNLNAGRNAILTLMPGNAVRFAFGTDGLPVDVLAEVTTDIEALATDAYEYKGPPHGSIYTTGAQEFTHLPNAVAEGAVKFASASAKAYKNSPFRSAHSVAVVEAVAHLAGRNLPQPSYADADVLSFWKISPGRGAHLWPTWRDGGYVAIGWGELGDLREVSREEFDERLDRLVEEKEGWTRAGAEQVWRFSQIPVGARVVANDGTRKVLGIGTVIGDYEFVDGSGIDVDTDGGSLPHRLPVRWDDLNERAVERGGWRKTLIKLKAADFEEILAAVGEPSEGREEEVEAETEDALDFDGIVANLADKGFHFSEETVATYLLALQAKRFVILSGISGTGKTALALEVARGLQGIAAAEVTSSDGPAALVVSVKPYNLQYRRITLPAALAKAHPGFIEAAEEQKRLALKYPEGEQEVAIWKPKAANTVFLILAGDVLTWFTANFGEGDPLGLAIEPDDSGVPAVVRVTAPSSDDATVVAPRRYEVVAVRPDWTDNNGLLGFYNPLTAEYTSTPFLSLLLRARDEQERAQREQRPARPFFVILDEMNLARVEHYFSDFLSCLESGEPVVLHDDLALEEQGGVPRSVRVPANLFFTGTVNVDESTYMFSPKVLDRAFTLEFNEVDLDAYGVDSETLEAEGSPLRLSHFEGRLRVQEKPNPKDWGTFRERSPDLAAILSALNAVLRRTHRHFGYRVANEIARFMNLASTQAGTSPSTRWGALDVAVLSKALPKLHGTQQELEATLVDLFRFAVDPSAQTDVRLGEWEVDGSVLRRTQPSADADSSATSAPPRLPRTAGKLFRMIERLRAHGFTSYIE